MKKIDFKLVIEVEDCDIKSDLFLDYVGKIEEEMENQLVKLLGEKSGFVNLILVDDSRIKGLNKRYREKDEATDVLSFAYLETEELEYGEEIALGDIFISVETVRKQAKEKGHSEEEEYGVLFVHGMLHLLGFDHKNDQEEAEMEEWAQRILKN